MPTKREQLEQAIAAQENLRGLVDEAVINATIAAIRRELKTLEKDPDQEDTSLIPRQRKLITVLFTDIVNSTRLVHGLDPEDVNILMDTALKRLASVIPEHHGHATRFMGDGFKAVFGLPLAREDDAEQAIRAGLDLIEAAKDYAVEIEQRWGLKEFNIRVGINTGWVVTGGFSEGEDTIMGLTVNLGARMEAAAPPGGVLISHDTYRMVRRFFDVEPVEPVEAKGFDEPVPAYHVLRVKPREFHRITPKFEGIETRMIGRDPELKALQDMLAEVLDTRQLHIITLLGEPGVGKSRLLYEFENWADLFPKSTQFYYARASKELQHIPLGLIRDSLIYRFQIRENNAREAVRKIVEKGLKDGLAGSEDIELKAHFIGELLGFDYAFSSHLANVRDDPQQISQRGLAYLTEYFQRAANRTPIIVLLEDLHWADESSLDVIERMASGRLANFPFLIVGAARPKLLERRPRWGNSQESPAGNGKSFHQIIHLSPLSTGDSLQLVDELLQKVDYLPDTLRHLIAEHTEGNALFIEELIKMLIEDRVIIKGLIQWQVTQAEFDQIRVPQTLEEILLAHLDSLPASERLALQQASVIGRIFWDLLMIHLNQCIEDGLPENDVHKTLEALCLKDIVLTRDRSSIPQAKEHMFHQAAMRDVVYESVLRTLRRTYHRVIADWLIETQGPDSKFAGLVGKHLELAGEQARAQHFLQLAGEQAAKKYANADAVEYFSQSLALCPETDYETCFNLTLARERVLDILGRRDKQQEDILKLKELGVLLGVSIRQAQAFLREAAFASITGDYARAIEAAKQVVTLAPADSPIYPEAGLQLGIIFMRTGKTSEAHKWFNEALKAAQAIQSPFLEANIIRQSGILAYYEGKFAPAKTLFSKALDIFRNMHDLWGEASSLNNLGAVEARQGFTAAAKPYFEQTLAIRKKIGDRRGEGASNLNLGNIFLDAGEYDKAIIHYQQALDIAQETQDRTGEERILLNMGIVYSNLGAYTEAKISFEQSLSSSRKLNDRRGESMALGNIANANYHLGKPEQGHLQAREALQIAQEIGDRSNQGHALNSLGNILLNLGRLDEALDTFQQVGEIGEEVGEQTLIFSSLAGQIDIALKKGEPETALPHVEEILFELTQLQSAGIQQTGMVYLVCYRALCALNDHRAFDVLQTAYSLVQTRSEHIEDERLKRSFVENVSAHREITEAYECTLK